MYFGPVFIVHIDIQPEKLRFFSQVRIFIIQCHVISLILCNEIVQLFFFFLI